MLMLVTGYEQPKGATKHNCRVYKEHDLLIADCSNNKTSIVVPDNLEPNIKVPIKNTYPACISLMIFTNTLCIRK